MSSPDTGYDWALTRVTELEVDVASALDLLERSRDEANRLRELNSHYVGEYRRLQVQHERLRQEVRSEQEEKQQLADEQQQQRAFWRLQYDDKVKELEELQSQQTAPRELDAIRMQLVEEIEEPLRHQLEVLEDQVAAEQQQTAEARRLAELQRLDAQHREQELKEELADLQQQHKLREQTLSRRVASLEAEVRQNMDAVASAAQAATKATDQEVKVVGLQRVLQEQERRLDQERKSMAEELRTRVSEVSAARRHSHELQVELDQSERHNERLRSELEGIRQEKVKMTSQLAEVRAQLTGLCPVADVEHLREELAQIRTAASTEKEQLLKAIKVAEEQRQSALLSLKRAESRVHQLENEEQELRHEQQQHDAEHAHQLDALRGEVASWRERVQALEAERREEASAAEATKAALRAQELRHEQEQLDAEHGRQLDALRGEELRHEQQQRDAEHGRQLDALRGEVASWRERVQALEAERREEASAAEATKAALRAQEQRFDTWQAEHTALGRRLESERAQWAREADEAHATALRVEEERRTTALQRLSEDHKRQIAKVQEASRKALQQSSKKKHELRQKCHDLVARVQQLEQEKASAVRICTENKSAYELRLAELGFMSRVGQGLAQSVDLGPPGALRASSASAPRLDLRSSKDLRDTASDTPAPLHDT